MSNAFVGSRILLVEDEESLAAGLEFNLTEEGYEVRRASDGEAAIRLYGSHDFDLILLDIMLPYLNGFEVAEKIREHDPQTPILMLTARTGVKDKVKGLETGADDYMTKPFHLKELLLRVEGMLRRKQWYARSSEAEPVLRFGGNAVDFNTLKGQGTAGSFQLTPREAMVLKFLAENRGRVVSRESLLENVWNLPGELETRTVDNFIARLRKYFEPDPRSPIHFKSVRGAGYIFEGDEA